MHVFVYGTLLSGERNHDLLAHARCLGTWETPPRFALYDVGPHPVLCARGTQSVRGEVYRINGADLQQLDRLEDYPRHYDRDLITTPWGPAWYYFQHGVPAGARLIASADWRQRSAAVRSDGHCR